MHSAELHGLYTSSNIIAATKSRMIRNAKDASYIASYMAEKKMHAGFWFANLKRNGRLKHLGDHGRILK